MRRQKGDIIINPWVSKVYNGDLNPCYATIYVGNGECMDYRGERHRWVGLNDENSERNYRTAGHIDLNLKDMIIAVLEADMKGENDG